MAKKPNEGGGDIEKRPWQSKPKEAGDKAEKSHGGWAKLGDGLKKAGELAGKAVLALVPPPCLLVLRWLAHPFPLRDMRTTFSRCRHKPELLRMILQKFKYAAELVDVSTETLTKSMAKTSSR